MNLEIKIPNKIPKIIHQIWFQGQKELPAKYIPFQQGWKDIHNEFKYILWDESKIASLLYKKYPWYYQIWSSLPYMIQKIDSAKMFILHEYGGVYADMDMECIMSIEPLLTEPLIFSRCYVHPIGIAVSAIFGLPNFAKTQINNGFMACTKKHPVIRNTILLLFESSVDTLKTIYGIYIAKSCGTEVMIQGLVQELKKNPNLRYHAYPSEFFEPKVKIRNQTPLITKNTRVIHHSDRTWIKDSPVAKIQL